MTGLLRAELRKLTTVTTTWVLSGIGLVLVGGLAALTVFVGQQPGARFTGSDGQIAAVFDQVGQSAVIVLIIAVLAMTTEFRHGTIGRTLQITPSRTRVLLGKLAVNAGFAVLFAVVALAVVGLLVLLGGLGEGVTLEFGDEVTAKLWQAPAALLLVALFGVAFGSLVRNQVVAITVALVWYLIVESIVSFAVPEVGRWFPFTAMSSVFLSPETLASLPEGRISPLEPGLALGVFLGYVVAIAVAALALMRHRDV